MRAKDLNVRLRKPGVSEPNSHCVGSIRRIADRIRSIDLDQFPKNVACKLVLRAIVPEKGETKQENNKADHVSSNYAVISANCVVSKVRKPALRALPKADAYNLLTERRRRL